MSPRKRMGNDPFDSSPSFIGKTQSESKKTPLVKKTSVVTAASKSADEAGEILIKLNMTEQNLAAQKEEIELLRNELNELKNGIIIYKSNPFYYWLRFWFPWFLH